MKNVSLAASVSPEEMAGRRVHTVLHYTGAVDDRGGVMSVLHALAGAGRFACVSGVNPDFVARRVSPLPTLTFPAIDGETINPRTFWRARAVARTAQTWLGEDDGRVFHAHSRAGMLAACWLARWGVRRVVVSVHCYGRRRWFYRWAARQMGGRLYWLSPAMKRYYGLSMGEPWSQCIPGCVPVAAQPVEGRVARAEAVLRIGGVGAVVQWKGWHLVVEAIAALTPELRRRLRFAHIGADGASAEARRYAAGVRTRTTSLGLDDVITWRGEQAGSTRFLREIDCLLVASENEPFSIAVLEALSAGVPVLAADSGGAQDLITEGQSGWFFRSGDSGSLAAQLAMLVSTGAVARSQVTESLIRPFAADVVADRWARVYAAL